MASSREAAHKQRGTQPRILGDALHDVRALHGIDHGIRQRRKGMIRGPQQNAAQPDDVAGDRKGNDLTPTVGQYLEAAGPARLENKRFVVGLTFSCELLGPVAL